MTNHPRILVAGIGNIFLGDDAFGVHVARKLHSRALPENVRVVDFAIRGLDLAYALCEQWDAAILIDAVARNEPPGTLFVIEPDIADQPAAAAVDGHSMDPVKVLALARSMGAQVNRLLVVGCQPALFDPDDALSLRGELSPPVAAAIEPAAELVIELIDRSRNVPTALEATCT